MVASDSADIEQIVVTGVRPLLSDKLAEDPQDVPQSLTIVDRHLMQAQGTTRLEEALRNVPGITLNAGEGAARGDTVNLRGFSAFNDFFLDGIRDAAVYTRDAFDLESVEVVKGPSAVLFGRGSTGGVINQVSKAPLSSPLESFDAVLGSNDLYRATADINAPLAPAGALRFNAMGESSHVAGRDLVLNRRWGVAPGLSLGLGQPDSVTVTYLHQEENNRPDVGIPFLDGAPAPVPWQSDFGLVSDRAATRDDIATIRYLHAFGPEATLSDTVRYAHYYFSYLDTTPNFGADPPLPGTPLSGILVGRDAPDSAGVQSNLTNQTDLALRFHTGHLGHHVVAGVEIARQASDLARYNNPFDADNNWVPKTALPDPNPYAYAPPQPVVQRQHSVAHVLGVYLTDTIALSQKVDLVLGGRYDRFAADYTQADPAGGARLTLSHTDELGSPRAALLYKATPLQTYYIAYGTSFDPSAEALSLTTSTAALGPVRAASYEVGGKAAVLDGELTLSAAAFHTVVDNAQTNDPDNPSVLVLNGNQRVQGVELGASGHLTQHWELFGGYTFLDSATVASGTPAYVGKQLPNAARNALNLWSEYELSSTLEIGAGANCLGSRFADQANTAHLPGYVVWNAMLSYRLSQTLTLQLNGLNLFDHRYFDAPYYASAAENHVLPAPGRSLMLTARLTL